MKEPYIELYIFTDQWYKEYKENKLYYQLLFTGDWYLSLLMVKSKYREGGIYYYNQPVYFVFDEYGKNILATTNYIEAYSKFESIRKSQN